MNITTKKGLLAGLVGLFAAGGMTQAVAQGGEAATGQSAIDEIIVTANKREQSLQDTAMAISALTSDTIEKRGLVGMDDYLRTLPSVNMQDRGAGQNSVVIRGITSTPQSDASGVGVYYGETPVTDLSNATGFGAASSGDLKLVDMERIEVLRGPQGTLYGSGSLSGTVRAIPISPNLDQVEGGLKVQVSQTGDQGDTNNMLEGVINIPIIEDELAIRAVAYRFDNSGYVENVAASQPVSPRLATAIAASGVARDRNDIGSDEYSGFRITSLWQPLEELEITLAYTQQKIEQNGIPEINLDLAGNDQQSRLGVGVGGNDDEFLSAEIDITNLVVKYDLGWASVTSSSSWLDYTAASELDFSHIRPGPYFSDGGANINTFVEELRLESRFDGALQFIAGVYFEDRENDSFATSLWSGDPALDPGPFVTATASDPIKQLAFFGELSYQITEQLTATVGGRHYDYDREQLSNLTFLGTPFPSSFLDKDESGNTFKANLSWSPSDDALIYGQWSEGFRLGGVQAPKPPTCDANNDGILDDVGFPVPDGIDADTTENFELGLKTTLLDSRVSLNAAVYRINWEGIPVNFALPSCSNFVILNAGKSKSEGVEIEVRAHLTEQLRIDFSTSYGSAELTEDASNIGVKGDDLPGSPDFNLSAGFEYGFTLSGYEGFARIDYSYVGEYFNRIVESGQPAGGYSQVNLRTGITINNLDIDLFINNLTNADDLTWVEEVSNRFTQSNRAYRLRPRVIGFNIGYRF